MWGVGGYWEGGWDKTPFSLPSTYPVVPPLGAAAPLPHPKNPPPLNTYPHRPLLQWVLLLLLVSMGKKGELALAPSAALWIP